MPGGSPCLLCRTLDLGLRLGLQCICCTLCQHAADRGVSRLQLLLFLGHIATRTRNTISAKPAQQRYGVSVHAQQSRHSDACNPAPHSNGLMHSGLHTEEPRRSCSVARGLAPRLVSNSNTRVHHVCTLLVYPLPVHKTAYCTGVTCRCMQACIKPVYWLTSKLV